MCSVLIVESGSTYADIFSGKRRQRKDALPFVSAYRGEIMDLYLAGGISGNLKPYWSDNVKKGKEGEYANLSCWAKWSPLDN